MKTKHLLSLMTCLFMASIALPVCATDITGVTGVNGVYNIDPATVNNGVGFRQYEKFDLSQGDVANLKYNHINTFVNLVDNQVKINGIVNTVAKDGNFHNGKAVFVSPMGVVIGASGVLNVGSLGVYSPTRENYNNLKGNMTAENYKSFVDNYGSESFGPIVVGGKVISAGNVDMKGHQINIQSTGGIMYGVNPEAMSKLTTQEQAEILFNTLVNTQGYKTGTMYRNEGNASITLSPGKKNNSGEMNMYIDGPIKNFAKGNDFTGYINGMYYNHSDADDLQGYALGYYVNGHSLYQDLLGQEPQEPVPPVEPVAFNAMNYDTYMAEHAQWEVDYAAWEEAHAEWQVLHDAWQAELDRTPHPQGFTGFHNGQMYENGDRLGNNVNSNYTGYISLVGPEGLAPYAYFVNGQVTDLSDITGVTPGYNGNGYNLYNIDPETKNNGVGFRKYDDFNLVKGDVANLRYDGINTFVNLIDNQANINGIVNTVDKLGNFYNGKAVFITPKGLYLGADGVMNVGSLAIYQPNQAGYDSIKNKKTAANFNTFVKKADYFKKDSGTSDKYIQLNGKVISAGDVDVRADQIRVGYVDFDGGIMYGVNPDAMRTLRTNEEADTLFNTLVNTKGYNTASVFQHSGVATTPYSNPKAASIRLVANDAESGNYRSRINIEKPIKNFSKKGAKAPEDFTGYHNGRYYEHRDPYGDSIDSHYTGLVVFDDDFDGDKQAYFENGDKVTRFEDFEDDNSGNTITTGGRTIKPGTGTIKPGIVVVKGDIIKVTDKQVKVDTIKKTAVLDKPLAIESLGKTVNVTSVTRQTLNQPTLTNTVVIDQGAITNPAVSGSVSAPAPVITQEPAPAPAPAVSAQGGGQTTQGAGQAAAPANPRGDSKDRK